MNAEPPNPHLVGIRAVVWGMVANASLALVKITTGIVGHSQALIADGVESVADIVGSGVTLAGLAIGRREADEGHPYGHGKAESMAAFIASLALIGAAVLLAAQCIREIRNPHAMPEWYTLIVLVLVVGVKWQLARNLHKLGNRFDSGVLKGDAYHHVSDALTSAAAFIGITVALIGGSAFASADDWAALLACVVIARNGLCLLKPAVDELMDKAVTDETLNELRAVAERVPNVVRIEKCRIRRSGMGLLMDIHVQVAGDLSVDQGHAIGHDVKNALMQSTAYRVADVVVHVEPA